MATFRRSRGRPPSEGLFTPSEERVLELIRQGKTNSEIANDLRISVAGVKYHVTNLLGKVGVQDRAALAQWRGNQRTRNRGVFGWPWPIVLAGSGAAAVLVVAVAVVAFALTGDESPNTAIAEAEPAALPTSTPTPQLQITPAPLKPQPPLREAASGNGWRLLLADDGLGLPSIAERVLAVAYDGPEPRVDVLGADGRIAARVETGHAPMARVNPATGDLLISDSAGPTPEFQRRHERLLVLDLSKGELRAEVPFEKNRVDFTVPHSAVWASEDGRFFYWIEHGTVCPLGGNGEVCDLHIFHAVNLQTHQSTSYAAPMPNGCGIPVVADSRGSALTVVCRPPTNTAAWKIDAASAIQDRPESAGGLRSPSWVGSRAGDSLLDVEYTSDGTLTGLEVFDRRSGAALSKWPVTAYEALLLDERTALVLRPDGRLERIDVLTGIGEQLPYAIESGQQGLDIRFYR